MAIVVMIIMELATTLDLMFHLVNKMRFTY